jgi:uncharacterized protein
MSQRADAFDIGRLGLTPGEGRRLELEVAIEPLVLGSEEYVAEPARVPVVLDIAGMTGHGVSLRLRFAVRMSGPCMRCLQAAEPAITVDAREIDQPGDVEELDSPYVRDQVLDLRAWARDALALSLPAQLVCRDDCAGLCPECGANLNLAGADHGHERAPDPRWAKLRELRLE